MVDIYDRLAGDIYADYNLELSNCNEWSSVFKIKTLKSFGL